MYDRSLHNKKRLDQGETYIENKLLIHVYKDKKMLNFWSQMTRYYNHFHGYNEHLWQLPESSL